VIHATGERLLKLESFIAPQRDATMQIVQTIFAGKLGFNTAALPFWGGTAWSTKTG
jgi:hypothetical protein